MYLICFQIIFRLTELNLQKFSSLQVQNRIEASNIRKPKQISIMSNGQIIPEYHQKNTERTIFFSFTILTTGIFEQKKTLLTIKKKKLK